MRSNGASTSKYNDVQHLKINLTIGSSAKIKITNSETKTCIKGRFMTLGFDEPSLSPPHSNNKTRTTSVSNTKLCYHTITNHGFV